ncbi:MAG: hypothetical protein KatS3mg060_3612 [Dehalococcoidia bacterium]|nr:MAG: hypothetical protein KatS3mg060_3612 [Dehalococcoidia bacterium]
MGDSLAPSVTPLLHQTGVWEAFLASRPLPSAGNRAAWGSRWLGEHAFLREPWGTGWHLDRVAFDQQLRRAAERAGVRLLRGSVSSLGGGPGGWVVATDAGTLQAEFVVDATGRRAALARQLGARRRVLDHQIALVAFLHPIDAPIEDTTTLVEAVPDGWWYSALLPDGRLSLAFFTDPERARGARSAGGWSAAMAATDHTADRLKPYNVTSRPRTVSAGSSLLTPSGGRGWLAVGDAAATYDPLSSHGVGTALAEGRRAGELVCQLLAGDCSALGVELDRRMASYAAYLTRRLAYYRAELRWPDSPFWARRHVLPRSGS